MPSNTPNLNLYKKNPVTDGDDTFNIETMINENLDKIDAHAGDNGRHVTTAKQAAWDAKETPAGAQAKANAARDAATLAADAAADAAEAAAKAASIPIGQKGAAGGVAALDGDSLVVGSGLKLTDYHVQQVFHFAFNNNVYDQKVNLIMIDAAGSFEIEIASTFSNANTTGKLKKRYDGTWSNIGFSYAPQSAYTEVSGTISEFVAIGEPAWDAVSKYWKIPIEARPGRNNGNPYSVKFSSLSGSFATKATLTEVYTGSASVLPKAVQVIPDDTRTQSGQKVLNSSDTGVFAPAVHEHNYIKSVDKRDVKPNALVPGSLILYFADRFGNTGNNDWQDMLVLNSYVDGSGGFINVLGFDKDSMRIEHIQATPGAADWGEIKTLAYVEDGVQKLQGMVPSGASTPNTIVSRNEAGNFAVGGAIYFNGGGGIEHNSADHIMYAIKNGVYYELLDRGNTGSYTKSYGILPTGSDLNTYVQPGNWLMDANQGYINAPTAAYALLEVTQSDAFIKQTFTEIWGNYMFYRVRAASSTSWSSWIEVVTTNSVTGFVKRAQVVAGTDLNLVENPGMYFLIASASYTNGPGLDWALMNVYKNSAGYVVQEVTGIGSSGRRFRTRTETGFWGAWMMTPFTTVASGKYPGITANRVGAIDTQVTVANSNVTIATYTPLTKAIYEIKINFRFAGAAPNITIAINYADGSGPQSMTLISQTISTPGSYVLPAVNITSVAGSPVTVLANINTANAVFVSAVIQEV